MSNLNIMQNVIALFEDLNNNAHMPSKMQVKSRGEQNSALIEIEYNQENFKNCTNSVLAKLYSISEQHDVSLLTKFPYAADSGFVSVSPSESKSVSYRSFPNPDNQESLNYFLDYFESDRLVKSVKLTEHHEKAENNQVFGKPFTWNKDETKVIYVANEKKKPAKHFSNFLFEKDSELEQALEYNKYKPDLGQRLTHLNQPALFEYDIVQNTLSQILLPDNLVPIFPQYADAEGKTIIFSAIQLQKEFNYGILHCFNRQSFIYHCDEAQLKQLYPKPEEKKDSKQEEVKTQKQQEVSKLTVISNDDCCFNAQISPDLKTIVYLGSEFRAPHSNYHTLKMINLDTREISEILKLNPENLYEKEGPNSFMGIIGYYDILKNMIWLKDSTHFAFNSLIGSSVGTYLVNVNLKEVARVDNYRSLTQGNTIFSYDSKSDLIFIQKDFLLNPPEIWFADCNELIKNFKELSKPSSSLTNDDSSVRHTLWRKIETNFKKFESFYSQLKTDVFSEYFEELRFKSGEAEGHLWRLKGFPKQELFGSLEQLLQSQTKDPRNLLDNERPIVIINHGGPHGNIRGNFDTLRTLFLLSGYNVLIVNFTGSAGFGRNYLENLLQKNGDIDAQEILDILDQIIGKGLCDQSRVAIMGGSYGGYMTGILGSRFGDRFKCAIMMNPCINLPFMIHITDIPEWVMGEVTGQQMRWNFSDEDIVRMHKASPNHQPMKVPTLLLLGAKDRRVPYQAGIAYRAQTLSNNVPIETYIYPEADHSLSDSNYTMTDENFKIVNFLFKHLD